MAAGSNAGRRLLAAVAVVCAVGGLLLAASAMPMLAGNSPAHTLLTDESAEPTAQDGFQSAESHGSPADSLESRDDSGDREGTADHGGTGEASAGGPGDGGDTTALEGGPGGDAQFADGESGTAERIAGGALYGLATLFSAIGGDWLAGADEPAAGEFAGSEVADAEERLEEGEPADAETRAGESESAESGMGGEFGALLTGEDDPDALEAGVGEERLGGGEFPDEDGTTADELTADDEERTLADDFEPGEMEDLESGETADLEDEPEGDGPDMGDGGVSGAEDEFTGADPDGDQDDFTRGAAEFGDGDAELEDGDSTAGSDETETGGDAAAVGDDAFEGGDARTDAEQFDDPPPDGASDEDEAATSTAESSGPDEPDAGGESTLEDAVSAPSTTTLLAAVLALALPIVGYVLYAWDDPIGTLQAIPGRVVSAVMAGVVACSEALERAVGALRGVRSIAELPGLVLAGIVAVVGSVRLRVRDTGSSLGVFDGDGGNAQEVPATDSQIGARERIREAFEDVIDASSMYRSRVATATPADVARSAKRAGAPSDPVETITGAFRDVEYGARDPEAYVDPTTAAHDRLRTELVGDAGEESDTGSTEASDE
ncbi:hypothetical protein [Natrarchaeobius chitinivorans]|uniref:DUF4129 domain-containing protein n=1 Tax=Natrarchaeobius chitinivorans TaxID=1679083 RepID=A0A3N6LQG5_NATCH|nr:hypothetical protein [Natrarchaeobius chitinivorans]RQG91853.1 hypothetical protein EA473_18890 [Natrarchaeobius chitinivorans]